MEQTTLLMLVNTAIFCGITNLEPPGARNVLNGFRSMTVDSGLLFVVSLISAGAIVLIYAGIKVGQSMQASLVRSEKTELAICVAEAEKNERQRIGRDLHDGLGQLFSVIKFNFQSIDILEFRHEHHRVLFDKTMALIDESCKEIRAISHHMLIDGIFRAGLTANVQKIVRSINSAHIQADLEATGFTNTFEYSAETMLYRIIQEAVSNVLKHAAASRIHIRLIRNKTGISACIWDNGRGFNVADMDTFEGTGLKNIISRTTYLDGKVNYISAPGKGTQVHVWVPVT